MGPPTEAPETRLTRFDSCGSNAWVLEDQSQRGHWRIACDQCHDRFCVPCARSRSLTIASNLRAKIADEPHRFVTLTLRSSHDSLHARILRLYKCFARLRRTSFWTENVTGGAAFLEIKWSNPHSSWHTHLHCLVQGRFLRQQTLSQLWLGITGDSFIVDVRLIQGHHQAVSYITKYASKPLNPSFAAQPDLLVQAVKGLHGVRLCLTFGSWRGVKLLHVPKDGDWVTIGSLKDIAAQAGQGDDRALAILDAVTRNPRWYTAAFPEDTS